MIKKYIFSILFSIISCVSIYFVIEKFPYIVLIFIIPLFFLFYKQKIINNIWVYIPSTVLTIFLWLHNSTQFIWSNKLINLKLILVPIGFFIFFSYFISFLYSSLNSINITNLNRKYSIKKLYIIAFCIILISWIPAWIAEYPNSLSPDTTAQFAQIFNSQPYSNGNPLVHTFFIKILFSVFSTFIKDINLNIALISVVSAIGNIIIFSYAAVYSFKKTNNIFLFIFTILFFSVISCNVFYGIQISKDITFSIFTILFIVSLDHFLYQQSIKKGVILFAIGLLFSLLRHNGYYMILGTLIALIPFIKNIRYRKAGIIIFTIFISCYIIIHQIYPKIIKAANKDITPIAIKKTQGVNVSTKNIIPLQQISYIVYKDWNLTSKQKGLIEKLAPLDIIRDNYEMYCVDPMLKTCSKYGDKSFYKVDKLEYYKLYFELFFKHPFDFIEAYCGMTDIYFYPFIREMNIYSNKMANNDFGFKKIRIISENYSSTVEEIYHSQYKVPIINLLLSPGIYTFFFIIALFYFLYSHQYNKFVLLIPIITNILILITVVPINGEFRYYLPMSVCLPIVLSLLLSKDNLNN